MTSFRKPLVAALVAACGILTAVVAAPPPGKNASSGNSYYLFTKALHVDDSGVVAVPSRFKWSVETCVAGFDLQANPIADSRVMLRLYDPNENFTAITAQMDLETAEKLQRELADIIAKKRQNPDFHNRPQLYDPSLIPVGEIKGVDESGVAIIELAATNIAAEDSVAIRKSVPLKSVGGLGTRGYSPLEDEVPFIEKITEKSIDLWAHIKMPKASNMTDEEWRKIQEQDAKQKEKLIPADLYDLSKQSDQYVGWFGIVRSMDYDANADQTQILAEHKYFDGLTDLHLQIVSIYGAGDFRVNVPGKITAEKIQNLSLIRAYGATSIGRSGIVTINPNYIRVWDWGLFTFMDYGKDKSNPKWLRLRKVSGEDAYRARVDQQFYEQRLGPRSD